MSTDPAQHPTLQHAEPPRATVVIPCFNHGAFVGDAVRSALAQDGVRIRVVIVNDGSSDGSTPAACDAAASLSTAVSVIHQPNAGLSAARNRGALAAREHAPEYLVFLDADDWIEPTFVARLHQAVVHAADPGVSHAYCQERLVDKAHGTWRVPEWDPVLLLVTNLHPVTALIRREAFEAVGGFDESMRLGYEDWDLWLRMSARGLRGVRVREPLFNWRRHSESTMVMNAVKRHDELFAMLMQRHADLYARHAHDIIRVSNSLLRRADANWLDESLDAIVVRDTRQWARDASRERDEARARADDAQRQLDQARAEIARIRAEYEAKPSVRLSRALFGAFPGPLRLASRLARRGKSVR